MKNYLLLTSLLLLSMTACAQDTCISVKTLSHCYKQQGYEIYILSEPVRAYDVVGRVDNIDVTDNVNKINDAINGTSTVRCKTILENVKIILANAIEESKSKKHGFTFDAIMTDDGTTGTCIKFK